jgi:hypothetical protein
MFHDCDKSTASLGTPIVTTPQKAWKCHCIRHWKTDAERSDAIRRDIDYELYVKAREASGRHTANTSNWTSSVTTHPYF